MALECIPHENTFSTQQYIAVTCVLLISVAILIFLAKRNMTQNKIGERRPLTFAIHIALHACAMYNTRTVFMHVHRAHVGDLHVIQCT